MRSNIILILLSVVLLSCQSNKVLENRKSETLKEKVLEKQPDVAFEEAFEHLKKNDVETAQKILSELESEYPYSVWSINGQLIHAYLDYNQGNYNLALNNAKRFIQMHPANKYIDYAYYLVGMCHYVQINEVEKDQHQTFDAKKTFEELLNRFPNSVYSKDAKVKIDLINDHLAGHQMHVGRFYLHKNHLIAAINRFNNVIIDYPNTAHSREALYRLVEIYTSMTMFDEANKYAAILGHNSPNSPWYHRAYDLVKNTKNYQK